MNRKQLRVVFCVAQSFALGIGVAASPSFECAKATTKTEHAICASDLLSLLDQDMADAYHVARAGVGTGAKKQISKEQISWIGRRNACGGDSNCIEAVMRDRIATLRGKNAHRAPAGNADGVTGTWEYHGPSESGMWLMTLQAGNEVRFQLEINRGAPSYNMGWIEGTFSLKGSSGVFRSSEYGGECAIKFEFGESTVSVGQEGYECPFGHGVHADGTLKIKSRKTPEFSP